MPAVWGGDDIYDDDDPDDDHDNSIYINSCLL
jgi:hypothetical protein